jgi:NADH-quinone oxidoreductase subunit J
MIVHALAFYLFSIVMIASAVMVILSRNPVHSVLFLILCFFNAAGMFLLIGAEFVAMILVIVYVGAVAVLFLFVVMMLDIDFAELRGQVMNHLPVGLLVGVILIAELLVAFGAWSSAPGASGNALAPVPTAEGVSNTEALGRIIYTDFVYLFQAAGIVLLIAMIGAIVLTLRSRVGVRRQSVARQVSRPREEVVAVRKVPTRGGV